MASDTAAVAATAAADIEDTSLSIPPDAADAAALGQTLGTYPAVYVRGLAADVGDAELRAAFARYGAVREAAVVRDARTGASRGYAFVRFAALAAAHAAAAAPAPPPALRGVDGVPPRVVLADPKNVLHCRRIPAALPEDAVRAALERITRLRVYRFVLHTHPSGRSKGYGWARFADHRAALLALERLRNAPFPGASSDSNNSSSTTSSAAEAQGSGGGGEGRPLLVSLAEPRVAALDALEGARALFVRGLAGDATAGAVRAALGGAAVERVFVPRARATHAALGTAVVHYRTRSDAARALAQIDGATVLGRRVHAEWWLPRDACRSHAAKTRLLHAPQQQQQCQKDVALQVQQQHAQQLLPLCPVVCPVLVPALPGAPGRRRRSSVLVPAAPAAGALCFAPFVPCPAPLPPLPPQPQRTGGRRRGRKAAAAAAHPKGDTAPAQL